MRTLLFLIIFSKELYAIDISMKLKDLPERTHSIIVTPEGFYPKNFTAFEGELVKFFVTGTTDKPSCFMIPSKNVYLSAERGKVSEGEAYFEKAGKFEYFCPTEKIKGLLTVLPRRKRVEVKKFRRQTASVNGEVTSAKARKIWRPKESSYDW